MGNIISVYFLSISFRIFYQVKMLIGMFSSEFVFRISSKYIAFLSILLVPTQVSMLIKEHTHNLWEHPCECSHNYEFHHNESSTFVQRDIFRYDIITLSSSAHTGLSSAARGSKVGRPSVKQPALKSRKRIFDEMKFLMKIKLIRKKKIKSTCLFFPFFGSVEEKEK